MIITPQITSAITIEIKILRSSSFLNPSKNEKIRNSQAAKAIKGATKVIAMAFKKESNLFAYFIDKNVVPTAITENTNPIISAAICELVI